MRKKYFALFMAVMVALSLVPTAIFALDEDDDGGLYPDAASYYMGEMKSGTVEAGSAEVYRVDTSSMEEVSCNFIVSNTSENESATLVFSVLDSSGDPKTEISTEAASLNSGGDFPGAVSSIELEGDHWGGNFFNISTGDYLVVEADSEDVSFTISGHIVYSPLSVECGEFYTNSFGSRAHLIPLSIEGHSSKETVFVENYCYDEIRHYVICDEELVADSNGYDWGQLEPDYWDNRAIHFDTSKDYYLLLVPMSDNAEYEYLDYYYDDDDDDYDYDYDDDDDDYDYDYDDYDDYDDDDDYDSDDDYDYAVAVSPQDLIHYTVKADDKTYDGKAQKPEPDVEYGGILLGTAMYSVKYSNNKNVGTAKITITGVAPNTGKIIKTFKINPKGTALSGVSASKKAITVRWKRQAAKMSRSRISGYEIQYSTTSSFSSARTKTVKGYKTTTKKISGLKAKKKYYVRIRTYMKVGGKKYCSPWSNYKAIRTR